MNAAQISPAPQILSKAWDISPAVIIVTDPSGLIEYVNPAFEKVNGYTADEVRGENPRILKSGRQGPEVYVDLWGTITSGRTWTGCMQNRRKDGTFYWVRSTISSLCDDAGKILNYIAVKENITEEVEDRERAHDALIAHSRALQETNGQLQRSIQRAEELAVKAESATRAKSEFLATMSHELRTPLNGVLGFAEILTYTTLDAKQLSYAQKITESGNQLLTVVNDILDFSSIEKGQLKYLVAPLVMADLVEKACLPARKSAADKGLAFRCEIGSGVPEQITGDARRISQILVNFLGNAVKFTKEGSVSLRVAASVIVGQPAIAFSVADTGIGISPETLGILFFPFTQGNSTLSRSFHGAGLGLAISKRLAEAMGGSITVISTLDRGSTFTFHLPLGIAHPASGSSEQPTLDLAPAAPGDAGRVVLVVEDDHINSILVGKMLLTLGYRAEFAADGAEAVEAFVPGKFFAILMDIRLPVMDGIAATNNIRERESGSRVPIIAVTANVMPCDQDHSLAAGMDRFLAKPFKRDELAAALAAFLPP